MPNIKWDWTFNIGHVISVFIFVISGVAAWYDVKSDVKVFYAWSKQVDSFMVQQKHQDELQDTQRDALAREIREALRDTRSDIKQEFRDLREDLGARKH